MTNKRCSASGRGDKEPNRGLSTEHTAHTSVAQPGHAQPSLGEAHRRAQVARAAQERPHVPQVSRDGLRAPHRHHLESGRERRQRVRHRAGSRQDGERMEAREIRRPAAQVGHVYYQSERRHFATPRRSYCHDPEYVVLAVQEGVRGEDLVVGEQTQNHSG